MVADGGAARDIEQQTLQALQAFHSGRLEEAGALCREILTISPASFGALHLIGAIAALQDNLEAAAISLREAVRLNPQSAEARGNLAEVLRRAGDFDSAAEQIAEALRLETRTQENYNRLGLIRIGQERHADAVTCFQAAIGLNSSYADAWHNLGFALEKLERLPEAVQAYGRALAIDSSRVETWTNLGANRMKLGDLDGATAAFRTALSLQGQHRPALIGLATALDRSNDPEAIAILAEVAELSPDDSAIRAAYGEALFHLGRFADATSVFRNAIERFGHRPELAYGLTQCRKIRTEDRRHIDAMIDGLRAADLSPSDRGTLNYAVGKALDDLGQYSQAIVHFDEANRNWRIGREFDRLAHGQTVAAMIENTSRASIEALRSRASTSELPIFVVGLPRSGTTLVEQLLSRHPEIGAGGEVEFWIRQVEALRFGADPMEGFQGLDGLASSYVALLENKAPGVERVVDKMPHNYAWLGLIHGLLPDARIIHCRRHPIDTCLSLYFTRFLNRHHFTTDRADLASYYRDYLRLMKHWRSLVPAERLLEIEYERLVQDQDAELRKIIEFCGLEWNDACGRMPSQDGVIRTASAWQARQPVYRSSVARWRNYEPWLGELEELLSKDKECY